MTADRGYLEEPHNGSDSCFIPRDCYNEDGTLKERHYTRAAAVAYRKRFSNSKNLRPYHCHYCGHWHLGHLWSVQRKVSQPVWR